jgi:hypothetical protein
MRPSERGTLAEAHIGAVCRQFATRSIAVHHLDKQRARGAHGGLDASHRWQLEHAAESVAGRRSSCEIVEVALLVIVVIDDGHDALAQGGGHVRNAHVVVHQRQAQAARLLPLRYRAWVHRVQVKQVGRSTGVIKSEANVSEQEAGILPKAKVSSREGSDWNPQRPAAAAANGLPVRHGYRRH